VSHHPTTHAHSQARASNPEEGERARAGGGGGGAKGKGTALCARTHSGTSPASATGSGAPYFSKWLRASTPTILLRFVNAPLPSKSVMYREPAPNGMGTAAGAGAGHD
jgi:hypothetical protein